MAALRTTRTGEAVGQNATLQIPSQLTFHIAGYRVPIPVALACEREVGLQVLLDEAVEDGLLGAATGVGSGAASLWVGGRVGSAA